MFGQLAASSQFYLYGRKHCTRTGWEEHSLIYEQPDILTNPELSLKGKVYMITGANAGIGAEMTKFLASKGATVYMVCRSAARASEARDKIATETGNSAVHVLLCDCSLEKDVRRVWAEFEAHQSAAAEGAPRLDGLVCNAGLLANEKTLTAEGVEITLAVHLLFGTYLLGSLALPLLQSTPASRIIAVSSGGMYNTKFPAWPLASSTGGANYDGQFAYAYAKRGQVLLMEQWAVSHPTVLCVSAHPGWTQTEAVDAAYGESKKWLQPLRTTWQGAEGICWLLVQDPARIEPGGFYLDRRSEPKHMAGFLGGEGTFTKNTPSEVGAMLYHLREWSSAATRPSAADCEAMRLPLRPQESPIEVTTFMGSWHVLAHIPTPFEAGASNCVEHYDWDEAHKRIQVTFTFFPAKATTPSTALMHGYLSNPPLNTQWSMNPKFGLYLPLGLTYIIAHMGAVNVGGDSYEYVVVSVPDRSYLWCMTRARPLPQGVTLPPSFDKPAPVGGGESQAAASVGASEQRSQPLVSTTILHPTLLPGVTYMDARAQEVVFEECLAQASRLGFPVERIVRPAWTSTV